MCSMMFVLISLLSLVSSAVIPQDYWSLRADFLHDEETTAIGGRLAFEKGERSVNDLLMTHKRAELDQGFSTPSKFLPGEIFMKALEQIEKSKVFKLIKRLPKGAVLHLHDTAMVHGEFLYNITFRDNLYICDKDGKLSLRFFQTPSDSCDWKLLSDLRKNTAIADSLDEKIRQKMTMVVDNPEKKYPNVDAAWAKFMDIFMFITPMLTYRPVWEDYYYQGLKELYMDNILYLELRSTLPPVYELDGREYRPLDVLGIYKNVTRRFKEDYPDFLGVKIIYTGVRSMNITAAQHFIDETIKLKRNCPDFVVGLDSADNEDKGHPLKYFGEILNTVKNQINFFLHAGKTNWYGTSADANLIDAVLLNTKRIGDGFGILKHPKVLQYVKKHKIAIEVCPISNQVLALVKDLRNHPAAVLFAEGVPVVVSNDDSGLWGSRGLSHDYYEAFMGIMSRSADIRALNELTMNSIIYTSLPTNEQAEALRVWKKKWIHFINHLNSQGSSPHIRAPSLVTIPPPRPRESITSFNIVNIFHRIKH